MKLDILAFGAHPDDVEISLGASLLKYADEGKAIGIVDLTQGELGTRGNADLRASARCATPVDHPGAVHPPAHAPVW